MLKKVSLLSSVCLALYGLAYLGFLYPWINTTLFFLIVACTIYLSFRAPEYGIYIALSELIIGGKGYIFSIVAFGQAIPIRYAIFGILGLVFLWQVIREKRITVWQSQFRWPLLSLALWILLAAMLGYAKNPHEIWFFDLNGYIYFLFVFPLFQSIRNIGQLRSLAYWGAAATLALIVFTFFLSTLFATVYYRPNFVSATQVDSGQLAKLDEDSGEPARLGQTTKLDASKIQLDRSEITQDRPSVYRWARDTGMAEISYFSGRIFRVFVISHLYILLLLFPALLFLLQTSKWSSSRYIGVLSLFLLGAALFIGFSRSFWFGLAVGILFLFAILPKQFKLRLFLTSLTVLVVMLGALAIVPGAWDASVGRLQSLFQPNTELAASNRLQLLPNVVEKIKEAPLIGSGFGTLVRYRSLVAGTDEVETVAVYVYEWGYLDLLVKLGGIGLLIYLIFLGSVFRKGFQWKVQNQYELIIKLGTLSALLSLLAAHAFTPYLNHPLGISAILMCALIFTLVPNTHAES
ncbi:MAG: O-antigen ligase family protein [Candidatus Nomurabacteria bacterium]|nr:MAG: O-antigen ligase family protein [Candidatus Nomurabacteria bacterium]